MCDLSFVLMLDRLQRESQTLAFAAVISGGEYTDPCSLWLAELNEPPVERVDADLRRALGLT